MNVLRKYYGKNICFYYYGVDHLVMNLYKYIKQNLENNICIYLYINKSVYDMLMNNLDENEKKMIYLVNIEKEILNVGTSCKDSVETNIKKIKKKALDNGYWGMSLIVDASKILSNTCNSMYEEFLMTLSKICSNEKMNILTCYDFIDYMERGKYINENIMKLSYEFHTFRMFGNEIIPVENFVLHDTTAYKRN
ncbi:MAG: MEDS domain-containing protein [Clostridium sp.]|nr:MEDS domain-containing protein [Clostridium sp.]